MAENGKHPFLKTTGAVATAVAAICGVAIGITNYMTEGKQDMVQESAFNILTMRVNQNIEQMRGIEERLFELAMICGKVHEEEDEGMEPAPISPEIDEGPPHVEMSPTTVKSDTFPPMPNRAERFDDFKQVQQYVQEENAPWEEGK